MASAILPVAPYEEAQVSDFRGQWSRLEVTDVPPTQALLSQNCEFNPGQVATRNGFASLFNPNKIITSLFNWVKAADGVSATGNYLVVYNATDHKVQWATNLSSPALTDLFSVTAEAVDPASSGNQLFLPTIDATAQMTPVGAAQCRIVGIYGAAVNVDKAFLGPMTVFPTLGNVNVGTVTAGKHFVGYVVTTRNGFTGKINPVMIDGLTPDQASSTIAPGGKQISVSINATWPTEAATITLVMTSTTQPFQFFQVPGAVYGVPGGSAFTVNAIIDLSDAQLINNTNDLTNNQFFLTQSAAGAGPFSPWKVIIYGGRTVYLTYDGNGTAAFYISEIDNPQQLTEQFNKKRLPGFLKMTSGFVVGKSLYGLGPNWTFAFQDNRNLPATWAPAVLVDGSKGTPCAMGVTVASRGDWAAVVDIAGLQIFEGTYQDKPLSYYVDDQWRRINWGAAQTIRIADNNDKKQILVAAPLMSNSIVNTNGTAVTWISGDTFTSSWPLGVGITINGVAYSVFSVNSPTSVTLFTSAGVQNGVTSNVTPPVPTHLMMFDYSDANGPPDYQSVKFSMWPIANYGPRALCVFQNNTTARQEFLIGKAIAGKVLRQMNTTDDTAGLGPWTDDGAAIDCQYEIGPQPQGAIGLMFQFIGMFTRIQGRGTCAPVSYSLDHKVAVSWTKVIQLAVKPGVEIWRQFKLNAERCSTKFTTGLAAGDYMILSGIRQKYYQWAQRR